MAGWETLESILHQNAERAEWERQQPPERCPHDGEVLRERNGVRDCPWGNYTWSQ